MKNKFLETAISIVVLMTAVLTAAPTQVLANYPNLNFSSLVFLPEADLVSATSNLAPGFSRRYENVATVGGQVIDAIVSIVSQSGNVGNELDSFDEYDNSQHLSAHTKPSGTAESSGKLKVEFVADSTNTPVIIANVRASIADIDIPEFGAFYGISRYRLSSDTQLSRSGTSPTEYRFHSSTTGSSNTDEKRLLEVDYDQTSSVTSAFGCRANATTSGTPTGIGAGGRCGFTVVIGTFVRTTAAIEAVAPRPTYTITYSGNSNTAGTPPGPTSGTDTLVVADNTGSLAKGQTGFIGWNTSPNGTGVFFPPNTSFVPTENVTLYAQYAAPPVAVDDVSSGAYDTNQTIALLTNDSAGNGSPLVASSLKLCATTSTVNGNCTLTSLTVANEGTYTVNADGTVTFDPLPTFTGTASPVKYVVADSTGQLASATITPTVSMPTAPVATPESKAVIPGGTATFTTISGNAALATSAAGLNTPLTCLYVPGTQTCDLDGVVEIAGEGTYTLNNSTGVVTYVASANATQGSKTPISYQVTDNFGQTATSTLTPVIPAPPVAVNDNSMGAYDTNQIISPLKNDSATSPATLVPSSVRLCATTSTANASCSLKSLTAANEGTYTVNADGTVTFDPLPTFTGTASPVKYVVADSSGQVANATITPTVEAPVESVGKSESKSKDKTSLPHTGSSRIWLILFLAYVFILTGSLFYMVKRPLGS